MKTVHTVREFIEKKAARNNATARIKNSKYEFLVNGKWISQKEFDKVYIQCVYKRFNEKGVEIGKYANL